MVSHENFITFNCNYVYIKYFNHHFNFCVSKSFYYGTGDALLQKAFTDTLSYCNIHLTYILLHMANLLKRLLSISPLTFKATFHCCGLRRTSTVTQVNQTIFLK